MITKPGQIRVIIVDAHSIIRCGIKVFMLAFDDIAVVAEAESGEQALQLCECDPPDVVLMALKIPGMGGIEATRLIRARYPKTQVVALTGYADPGLVQGALQAGAIGYLLKDVSATELATAIRAAHSGRPMLSSEATLALAGRTWSGHVGHDLTPREREVLDLLIEGLNNSEIAERLVVSRATIKFHVSSILAKLGVDSRAEAVVMARQNHLVET